MNIKKRNKNCIWRGNPDKLRLMCPAQEKRAGRRYCKKSYHHRWGPFTQKLRRLMKENPTLPVVLSSQLQATNDALDCSVAYVYDQKAESFLEKVILVHNVQSGYPGAESDDSGLPF